MSGRWPSASPQDGGSTRSSEDLGQVLRFRGRGDHLQAPDGRLVHANDAAARLSGGEVVREVRRDDDLAIVTVTDRASESPRTELDLVFEPYRRASNARGLPASVRGSTAAATSSSSSAAI